MADDENIVSRTELPKKHPHSDPEYAIEEKSGRKYETFNILACGSPNCPASFSTTRKRAWHMSVEHPGEYNGPTEDMMFLSGIMKERYGKDADMGRSWTKDDFGDFE